MGKGRFRQEMMSRRQGQGDAELLEMQRQHEELDRELEEKRLAIERGKHFESPTTIFAVEQIQAIC